MLNSKDKRWLENFHKRVVLGCGTCHGTDLGCDCYSRFFFEIKVVKAQIPRLYRGMKLEHFRGVKHEGPRKVERYIQELDKNYEQGRGLYLYGGLGTAKTALASLILREVLKKDYTGYFTDVRRCIDMFAAGWSDEVKKEEFRVLILESDFLILDDIGKEYGRKDFLATELESLFRERSTSLLPTIVTSNRSIDSLKSDYGERIASLFQGHLIQVECIGIDYRKTVLAKALKNP